MALLMSHLIDGKSSNEISIDYSSSFKGKDNKSFDNFSIFDIWCDTLQFPLYKYNSNNNNIPKPIQTIY